MDYTDLTRVKAAMKTSGSVDDTLLSSLITAVSRAVDRHCTGVARLEAHDYFKAEDVSNQVVKGLVAPDGKINAWPRKPVVNTVSALAYRSSPLDSWTAIDDDVIEIDGERIVIWMEISGRDPLFIRASYNGGFATAVANLPADLVESCTGLVIRWYNEDLSGLNDIVGVSELGELAYAKAIPSRIQKTLAPFVRVVPW